MPLERHQRVARIWDWLPAFRAVAEYQSLQRAGLALAVSPSALSRSVKLLEEALGLSLFTRSATGLLLTAAGERLLAATRDAMRRVDDGVPELQPGRVRLGAAGPALQRLVCEAALDAQLHGSFTFSEVSLLEAGERLLCGDLDVVLAHEPLDGQQLRVEPLPSQPWVLAVGPGSARDRVATLEASASAWPSAVATAATLEQLFIIAGRMGLAAVAPLEALPQGWQVAERQEGRPVFMAVREYAAEPPAFIAALHQALVKRLSSGG